MQPEQALDDGAAKVRSPGEPFRLSTRMSGRIWKAYVRPLAVASGSDSARSGHQS